jgi:hypothetical protein
MIHFTIVAVKRLLFILLILACLVTFAQTKTAFKEAKKLYEGEWVEKKTKRHISITLQDTDYFLINDWSEAGDGSSVDAYRAFLKKGKLIMPEDTEHHAPYAELFLKNKRLVYLSKYKDINGKFFYERVAFVKIR